MNVLFISLITLFLTLPTFAQTSPCSTTGTDVGALSFSEYVGSQLQKEIDQVGLENPLNQRILSDIQNLKEANKKSGILQNDLSFFEYSHRPGCFETLTSIDGKFKDYESTNPLKVKNYSFKTTYAYSSNENENQDVDPSMKEVVVEGSILTDASCEELQGCETLHQVYIHRVSIEIPRVAPVGGSTSAGGIVHL